MTVIKEIDVQSYNQAALGKRNTENFPVASWLMPKRARAGVLAFYNFARHADDIADEGDLTLKDRLNALKSIDNAIANDNADIVEWAESYMRLIRSGDLDNRNGRALLSAFSQDVSKLRYDSWEDLIDYCMRSAAPVGRAVLELHHEWSADIESSDKLCNVLQILNHLQDLKNDYIERDRVYFPSNWFEDISDLGAQESTISVRQAIDKALDKVDIMLDESKNLPSTLSGKRIRAEIATIWYIAKKLSTKLRKSDPLQKKINLSKLEYAQSFAKGMVAAIFKPSNICNVAGIMGKTKSSFFRPLLPLSKQKQQAMFALYAFCRAVDDAVDDAPTTNHAKENISFWNNEIKQLYSDDIADYPNHPITRSLLPHVKKYSLDKKYFDEILLGMEMDISDITRPEMAEFELYCYLVASCVGHLSVAIFGEDNENGHEFADALGKSLQIINIMRDVYEDAVRDRIYLPKELLEDASIGDIKPTDIVDHLDNVQPKLQNVLQKMGDLADQYMNDAFDKINDSNRENLKPALAMAKIYQLYHKKIRDRNYQVLRQKVKLSWLEKLRAL